MKTVVVTGASTGIGLATVEACIRAGHRVLGTARKAEDLARLTALGAEPVALELSDEQSVAEAAARILEKSPGGIDALFNNAGYGLQVAMEDTTWSSLQLQHTINVIGPIQLTNQLLPGMNRGSKLIFNSSVLGLITVGFRGPYCMSKHALEAAADAYRVELESLGIDVHVLQPGPIEAQFRAAAHRALEQTVGERPTRLDYSEHVARLVSEELTPGTLPAASCAEIVVGIIDGRRRKNRYLVTRTAKLAAFLKRLLGSGFNRIARRAEPVKVRA